ncbi:MAG: hypothetical protein HY328_06190 [Chloroflexi bacterium]|nr:hypothetical protein [Chloroflexota bacterium]
MPVVRGILVGLVGAVLLIVVAACRPAPANGVSPASGSQTLSTLSGTPTLQQAGDVVWGRVPYCSCLVDSATDNVARALKEAKLTVSLKELSPRDGWLYFAVTFDPHSATWDQVDAAMLAGGAEVIEGPP